MYKDEVSFGLRAFCFAAFCAKEKIIINKHGGKFNLYPVDVFNQLKKEDILNVGFDGLQLKILNKIKFLLIIYLWNYIS